MREPAGVLSGSDHSLHVRSGFAELPERVRNASAQPFGRSTRQLRLPHLEAVPESCTGASYVPLAPGASPNRKMRPMLPVAARTECSDGSSRVVSPSFV